MTPEELKAFLATGKKPSSASKPTPQAPAQAPFTPAAQVPTSGSEAPPLPAYATGLLDELREMASQEDFADVELSAASLAEIMAVVQDLPYPPDIFIDECLDVAVTALENQKRVYIQRVMSGEKQSGIRNKKKAVALALDISLDDLRSSDGKDMSDCFVL
jgi:hypothetical protein